MPLILAVTAMKLCWCP